MKKLALLFGGLAVLLLCTALAPARAAGPGQGNHPLDIILVLDNSGSMQKNDPNHLMERVAVSFLESLGPGDQLAMLIFDTEVKVLQPLQAVADEQGRQAYGASLSALDYRGKWTNSHKAVERAIYLLKHNSRQEARRVMIFMTDGILETGNPKRDPEALQWLKQDLARDAKNNDIRIFGLAFTEAADFSLIQSLAVQTGGEYYRALLAEEIEGVFQQITRDLAKLQARAAAPEPAPTPAAAPQASAPPPVVSPAPPAAAPEAKKADDSNLTLLLAAAGGLVVLIVVLLLVRRGRRAPARPQTMADQDDDNHLPNSPRLLDLDDLTGQDNLELPSRQTVIGRERKGNVNLVLARPTISSLHATIHYQAPFYYLEDQRSTNGTFLNSVKLEAGSPQRLKSGDEIVFDQFRFRFVLEDEIMMGHTQIGGMPVDDLATQMRPVTQEPAAPAPQAPSEDRWPSSPTEEQGGAPATGAAPLPPAQEAVDAPPSPDDPWAGPPASPGDSLSSTAYTDDQEVPPWPQAPAAQEQAPAATLPPSPPEAPTPGPALADQAATMADGPGLQPTAPPPLEAAPPGPYEPLESPTMAVEASDLVPTPPAHDLTATAGAGQDPAPSWPQVGPEAAPEAATSPGLEEPYAYIESPTVALEEPPPPRDLTETAGGPVAPGLSSPGQRAEPPTQVLGRSTHAESEDEGQDNLNRTMIKMPNCPHHPDEAATELCPQCRQAYCAKCMTEKDGKEMCLTCAKP